ncbi:sterol desaturase family protein [Spongorhabdus nitratireducens]
MSGGLRFLVFLGIFVLLEAGWLILQRRQSYPWKPALASFAVAAIKRIIEVATAGIAAGFMFWVYSHRFWTIEITGLASGFLFFLLLEFCYYWHHRWAHEIRWLWATHCVHHTPADMNLSVSGRLGWTGLISGSVIFFAPLALIGFHPLAIFLGLSASLFYQIWIHTELVGKLGPLEWVFNTPSHHRAHHGSNRRYINKNYGGVLIIYDRIFGTFVEEIVDESEPVVYGLTRPVNSNNPFRIALHEWFNMARDLNQATSWKHIPGYLFGPPGWKPGRRRTGQQRQA